MSVTAPLGFRAAGVTAGLKPSGQPDVAVVLNDGPSRAAAARLHHQPGEGRPGDLDPPGGRAAAGSGPWCSTPAGPTPAPGPLGFQDTHATAEHLAAARLARTVGAGEIAVCSTGLIGERLPMDKLLPGVSAAVAEASRARRPGRRRRDQDHRHRRQDRLPARRRLHHRRDGQGRGHARARAGHHAVRAHHRRRPGAGQLDAALRKATATTFDRLDTDGCMSTNDTVLLMASGASGVTPDKTEFTLALTEVCADLARQLQLDAEGANKMIAIEVIGAASEADAVTAGRAVARNNLLKCAIGGEDPNWGRVLSAVGTTDAVFEPDRLNVAINGIWVCRHGAPGDERVKGRPEAEGRDDHRGPVRGPALRHHLDHRPDHRLRAREFGVLHMTLTDSRIERRLGQGGHADRGAALAEQVPRPDRGDQVRRARDGRRGAPPGLRPGPGVPALRRAAPGRGARRRPADQRAARPARRGVLVHRRAAGHHPGGHGGRPDGPVRHGEQGHRRPDQPARPVRGGPVRGGRAHCSPRVRKAAVVDGEPVDIGLVGDIVATDPGAIAGAAGRRPDPGRLQRGRGPATARSTT